MIRRPPRSTLFPYHDALPICLRERVGRCARQGWPAPWREAAGSGSAQAILAARDRKSTRLNSSHLGISYAVFCLKKKKKKKNNSIEKQQTTSARARCTNSLRT